MASSHLLASSGLGNDAAVVTYVLNTLFRIQHYISELGRRKIAPRENLYLSLQRFGIDKEFESCSKTHICQPDAYESGYAEQEDGARYTYCKF